MTRDSLPNLAWSGAAAPARSLAFHLFVSLRPAHWTKNLIVFAGLIFGLQLFDPVALATATGAFVIFCALSGAVYLMNDVADRDADRRHPLKARRPVASGAVSAPVALATAAGAGRMPSHSVAQRSMARS